MEQIIEYLIVLLLGALFGLSELVARYKDEPWEALRAYPSLLYIVIQWSDVLTSLATLYVVETFGWTFGISSASDSAKARVVQVLVAGFSSMALLRSSLFTVRIRNQDFGIGLVTVVQVLLNAADAAVDRKRGMSRDKVAKIMDQVAFDKAVAVLPAYCLALMQSLSPIDQQAFARDIERITKTKTDSTIKSRMLGLAVMNAMGTKVLIAAVESLGDNISIAARDS